MLLERRYDKVDPRYVDSNFVAMRCISVMVWYVFRIVRLETDPAVLLNSDLPVSRSYPCCKWPL